MISIKLNEKYEKTLQFLLMITTYVMIILRFLLNEKGRTNPDSIRYMRQSEIFPIIDNTTAPLGYPLSIKFFTYFGIDDFWSSKLIGILAYTFLLFFAYKKGFFFKELLVTSALFSFVSIFSFTMSEALTLPFVILFFYVANQILNNKISTKKAIFSLSLILILLINIRYSALFLCFGTAFSGLLNYKKTYWKSFVFSGIIGIGFYGFYKFLFIDYFNENYVNSFLEIGLKSTPTLLLELYQGLATSFNPFIHIADPNGGIINYGIYGIGVLTITAMVLLFIKTKLSEIENFILITSLVCIVCSYFIQYVYSVNAIDYRLLAPFAIGIWLVFFSKLFQLFDGLTYSIAFLSLMTGFAFTWLSKGSYLDNRKEISKFLEKENMKEETLKFYIKDDGSEEIQTAELISTVNPKIYITFQPKDTLQKRVLTRHKVETKMRIKKNNYQ
ncbi:hypothetical protein [Epilithonimonas lactis]|uniref:Dolichyl-phosphate-mannose-protein mannosyltransferase n=1 Tax=Epilithonimonas lactis TaxID=421072 RepID=A0A085BFB6_9FLAO|nr:hypothetical protein [Epilithonimonas lactis]KFC21161.1 hypothetical protein IO89_13195 [Epilithonimonas lactis]SEP75299.1 hypothetical protein SAMN04488097_0536 [Epilithonimonas lactis]